MLTRRKRQRTFGPENGIADAVGDVKLLRLLEPFDTRIGHPEIGIMRANDLIVRHRVAELKRGRGAARNYGVGIERPIFGGGVVLGSIKLKARRFENGREGRSVRVLDLASLG